MRDSGLELTYRIIVLDLDGTLLNSRKEVSDRNREAVLACKRKGMRIVFATARPPRSVRRFLPEDLLQNAAFVYYNGAQAVCTELQTEFQESIPATLTAEIIDYCREHHPDLHLSVEARDEWYGLEDCDYRAAMNVAANPAVKPIHELRRMDATKILLAGPFEGHPLWKELHGRVNLLYTDRNRLVQIMPLEASKERAVRKLCSAYGCGWNEVLVFGDDHNDLGLFQVCGHSVAMGNAVPELQELADEITAGNDEDGVALVLERILEESRGTHSPSYPNGKSFTL